MATQTAVIATATGQAVALPSSAAATLPSAAATAAQEGPAEAANEASALLMARLQKRRIEILTERTSSSETWANPDGLLTTEAYSGPVRVKDASGDWQDVDTTLADTGSVVEPKAAAAEVSLSDGGTGTLASLERGKHEFAMGWATSLPAPTLKGDTAVYPLGDGADLTVQALPQGFEQSVVLSERPDDPVSYRIPLELKGLRLEKTDTGHLRLEDSTGKIVAEASAPSMWGSDKDRASGDPAHVAEVDTVIEKDADGGTVLVLKPDPAFLADPAVAYPVTVDPVSTLAASTDTWVATNYPDSQRGSTELKAGTYDAGATKARSYVKFDVARFKGKHIVDTNLALYSYYSSTCATTGSGVQVRRVTADWDPDAVTWGAQPATTTTDAKTSTAALGYSSSCPAGTVNFDVDGIVQAWADGSANHGLQVRGMDETDSLTWRRFRSANHASGDQATEPHLTVTYNSYGTTSALAVSPSALNAYNGSRYVTSLTPLLSAKVGDTDGGTVRAQFEITPNPAHNDAGSYAYTGTSAGVSSGATATLTVPSANALPAGAHLRARVRAYDGTDYGAWSGYADFTLNTAKPAAPTVSCTPYARDAWTVRAAAGAQCTFDTSSTDGQGYSWGLDDPAAPQRVDDTANGTGGDPLTVTVKPADGWHTLYAKTIDSGGNVSTATTAYSFGVGEAALLTPRTGERPNSAVRLSSRGGSQHTGVTYQYRRADTDSWANVPLADVAKASDGSAVAAWPLAVSSSTSPALSWSVTRTLAEDGPVQVRAAFSGGSAVNTPVSTVVVDRWGGADLSEDITPGGVNAVTGDHTLAAADAKAFGMTASRTSSSRRPDAGAAQDGQAAIYGPQWAPALTLERSTTSWSHLRKVAAGAVEVVRPGGETVGFTATPAGGWTSEPGSEHLTLTGSPAGTFTLRHSDGSLATFAKVAADATAWQLTSASLPTDHSTTTVVWDEVVSGGRTLARPKYVVAPTTAATASTCAATPATRGCRVLEYVYADTTTATAGALGDHAGQVRQIRLWATGPGATAATATALTQYAYDTSGRLREQWDPRITPALKTAYTYTSAGQVATLTPPGELPWSFAYGQVGAAAPAGPGMLLSASRATLTPGSATATAAPATSTVVYDVALSGTAAPYGMAAADVAEWDQTDVPAGATAVFPADAAAKAPASNNGGDAATADYARATVTYFDASGREVNTAQPGGHISTTEYDAAGNTVRELTAANRELALAASGDDLDRLTLLGIDALSTAERARQLSAVSTYSADGARRLHEYGPLHLVVLQNALKAGSGGTDLPAGSQVPARRHTAITYDEGRPTDGSAVASHKETGRVVSATVEGYPQDADPRTTRTVYDWSKGLAVQEVQDPGAENVVHTTAYDAQGRTLSERDPLSSGTDAGATVHRYWSATGAGACQGRPEWADLLCSTGAADGSGSTETTEYDRWGQVTRTVVSGGNETRTTTLTKDAAGRTTGTAVTGNGDRPVAATTTSYDEATGRTATVSSTTGRLEYGYDRLGRPIRHADGAGNVTTTDYDPLGRPVKVADSVPSTVTYAYDTAKDPRGLATGMTDSVAGAFTASYDADGAVVSEQLPGSVSLDMERDPAGNVLRKTYTASDGVIAFSDNVDVDVHGQNASRSQTKGSSVSADYTVDALGRSATMRSGNWLRCLDETYAYDDNTNLTSVTTKSGSCFATERTTEVTSHTYDSAGRITSGGHTYDALGRATAQGSATSVEYYANGAVHRRTDGSARETFTYDAAGRAVSSTTETLTSGAWTPSGERTYHYAGQSGQLSWEQGSAITRHVGDLLGESGATTAAEGTVVLELNDLDGVRAVQLPLDQSLPPVVEDGDSPQISPNSAVSGTAIASFGFDWGGASFRVPTGCFWTQWIRGSGRKVTYQDGVVDCYPPAGLYTKFCNWKVDFHYADTKGRTYSKSLGKYHNSCAYPMYKGNLYRERNADFTLKHYGKACAHLHASGKRRAVTCIDIVR